MVDLTSPIGMGLIQGLSYVPLAFILSVQTFRAMNPALEETARIHGLVLVGPENVTLLAAIWSFWAAGGRNQAAAVTLLMTALLIPLLALFWWVGRRSQIAGGDAIKT